MVKNTSGSSSTYNLTWAPAKRSYPIHVLIPSTFAGDASHLRERTMRIGFLCRALAIFRVEQLIVYHEDPGRPERGAELIKLIADYMNTAPYLRRLTFGLRRELSFVGLLPPLNVPTHPVSKTPPDGLYELREGLVIKRGSSYLVEAGLSRPLKLHRPIRSGRRVVLMTTRRRGKLRWRLISRSRVPSYLGFKTSIHSGRLDEAVRRYRYSIATSRLGVDFRSVRERITVDINKGDGPICLAFGSYKNGLEEIAEIQGFKLDGVFSAVLNLVPEQGVRTVRTEEAVYASLSALNLFIS